MSLRGDSMKFRAHDIRLEFTQGKIEVVLLTTEKPEIADLKEIVKKGKDLAVEIKPHRGRRSLDANAYLWVLCQRIAEVIGSTKELVYRDFIRRVGQFEILPIRSDAVDKWIEVWNSRGLGWCAEVLEDSKLPGYKKVISYYGSSVYDTREMSVLIDEVVRECKELGIETLTPCELMSLKENWQKNE